MQDEPFGSLSIAAQYRVMGLASRSVKVVLDGQGADEQLGGYLAYQGSYLLGLLHGLHLTAALSELAGSGRHHGGFFPGALRQILVRRGRRSLLRGEIPAVSRYMGSLGEVLKREILSTNLPALLHWEDRNSMAFSLEARLPFLDYRLIEYVFSLPPEQKIRGGVTKVVLRHSMKGILPETVRNRMDKMGFATPMSVWLRKALREWVLSLLESKAFAERGYFCVPKVKEIFMEHCSGKKDHSSTIWRCMNLELWFRAFIDRRPSGTC